MLSQALAVFNFAHGQPASSLDLTGALGPFSAAVAVGLGVVILGVAVLTALLDSWWSTRQAAQGEMSTRTAERPAAAGREAA